MKEILKDIFTKSYQGKSFVLDSLLKPLLGDYKPSNEDILHNSERKKLAENTNVKAITRIRSTAERNQIFIMLMLILLMVLYAY